MSTMAWLTSLWRTRTWYFAEYLDPRFLIQDKGVENEVDRVIELYAIGRSL